MFCETVFLTTFQPANKCKLFFGFLIIEGGRKNAWFLFLPSSVFCRMSDDHRMFFFLNTKQFSKKKRRVPTMVGISIPGKLLLVSINFTPKTSHSCLKKRYFPRVFQVPPKKNKTGDFNGIFQGSRPVVFHRVLGESGPVVRRSTHSSARRAIPGAKEIGVMFGKNIIPP